MMTARIMVLFTRVSETPLGLSRRLPGTIITVDSLDRLHRLGDTDSDSVLILKLKEPSDPTARPQDSESPPT
jgi:hypothetical protein